MKTFLYHLNPFIQFTQRISLAIVQVFVLALSAWLVLRLYPGDRWLFVRLGNYFTPWLLLALGLALAVALISKRRTLTGFIILLTLILGAHYIPMFTPQLSRARAQSNTQSLRVMTFNVHYANRNAAEIADLISIENPDIIALQELTPGLAALLWPQLESEYPFYLVGEGGSFEKGILSRYPLIPQAHAPESWGGQPAVVEHPRGAIVVWNLHPPPAVHQNGWEAQHQTLSAIAKEIKNETRPLIVLGDFNTTDRAENYHLLANNLTDVHYAVGHGFGFTFPEPDVVARMGYGQLLQQTSPVVRIDHILVNEYFDPQETHIVPNGYGSDHRPVVATLHLNQ